MNTTCMTPMAPEAPALPRGLAALRRRFNAMAYDLVNEELALLAVENEHLRTALLRAEEGADYWQAQAVAALEQQVNTAGGRIGMTQTGELMVAGDTQHGG